MVDDRQPKGVCMFCWARFAPAEAIRLEEDPGDHEFPNETQEEPDHEERELAFGSTRHVSLAPPMTSRPAPKRAKRQPGKLTPAEKVAMQKKELVVPRVSRDHRIKILGGILALLLVLAAIFAPLTLVRGARRAELAEHVAAISGQSLAEDAYSFSGMRNTELLLVTNDELSAEDASAMYTRFQAARAEVYNVADPATQQLRLRVAGSNGLYVVNKNGPVFVKPEVTIVESEPDATPTGSEPEATPSASN